MDDYLDSFNDLTIAVSTILSVSTLLKDGGFHLTKWTSNSIDILSTLPKDDISPRLFLKLCYGLRSEKTFIDNYKINIHMTHGTLNIYTDDTQHL